MVPLTIDLEDLKAYSTTKTLDPGSVIINEGDKMPYSMFVILEGKVKVCKNYGQSNEKNITELKSGEFFGEMSLFLKEPRSATVVADTKAVILEINQNNTYKVIKRYPELPYSILTTLCKRIQLLNQKFSIETA